MACRMLTGRLSAMQSVRPVASLLAQASAVPLSWQRQARLCFRGSSGSEQLLCTPMSSALILSGLPAHCMHITAPTSSCNAVVAAA